MKVTYYIDDDRVGYDPVTDTLFLGYGDYPTGICTEPELVDDHIDVMHGSPDGGFAGAAIFEFRSRYGDSHSVIEVNAREPFEIILPRSLMFA